MADFLKRAARQAVATVAVSARLRPVVPRGRAVILRYHRIVGPNARPVPLGLPADEFEAQLDFLRERCHVTAAGEIVAALAAGEPLPPRAVAITFDDGYADNHSQAFRLLQTRGLRASFFVTAGWIGSDKVLWWDRVHDYIRQALAQGSQPRDYEDLPRPVAAALAAANLFSPAGAASLEHGLLTALRGLELAPEPLEELVERIAAALGADEAEPEPYRPMNWEQVRELREAGMEIGSHTMSHALLATVPAERAYEELEKSKQAIEKELGQPVGTVAYPAGSHNADVLDLVKEAGYQAAFTTVSGPVCPGDDPFRLRRIGVWAGGYQGAFRPFSAAVFGLQLGRLARKRG